MQKENRKAIRKPKDSVPLLSADYAQSSDYMNCQQVHDGNQAPWADGLPDMTSDNEAQPRRRARPALQDYMTFPMVHKKADDDTFDLPLL